MGYGVWILTGFEAKAIELPAESQYESEKANHSCNDHLHSFQAATAEMHDTATQTYGVRSLRRRFSEPAM